jgi:hypothetical protein
MGRFLLIAAAILLTACKAEKVEVSLDANVIVTAVGGTDESVEFEAVVGEKFTKVDSEKRDLIASVESVITEYFPNSEVDVNIGADEYEIEVQSSLIVSKNQPTSGAPWYISSTQSADGEGILVQLIPSQSFEKFSSDIKDVNIMLGPDEFQPVEYRFTAASGTVIVGGAIVDGVPMNIARIKMTGQRVKMQFKDGIWEQAAGAFIYIP